MSQFSFSFLFKGAPEQSYVPRHSLIYLRDLREIRDMPVAHQDLNVDQGEDKDKENEEDSDKDKGGTLTDSLISLPVSLRKFPVVILSPVNK